MSAEYRDSIYQIKRNRTTLSGSWTAGVQDRKQFVTIEFKEKKEIRAILTQGAISLSPRFIKAFKFLYSQDCKTYDVIKTANGTDKMFTGGSDPDTVVTNTLARGIVALCVQIHPTDWSNVISMRFDILGCNAGIGTACKTSSDCITEKAVCIDGYCTCETGIFNRKTHTCNSVPLLPFGAEAGDSFLNTNTQCGNEVEFKPGFPVQDEMYTRLYVCTNGYVSIGMQYANPNPPSNASVVNGGAILAPFYANILNGNVSYRTLDTLTKPSTLNDTSLLLIKQYLSITDNNEAFDVKFALIATWSNMLPYQTSFQQTLKNTFQLVMASDGISTHAIFIYGKRMMNWKMMNANRPDVFVGVIDQGKLLYSNIFSFKQPVLQLDAYGHTKGVDGLIIKPLTTSNKRMVNYAVQCLSWYKLHIHEVEFQHKRMDNIPSCPCSLSMANRDPLVRGETKVNNKTICIDILISESMEPNGMVCCYDKESEQWTGEIPYAGGLYAFHPDFSMQQHIREDVEPKTTCCEKSNYCHLYYKLRPIGTCYKETWFDFAVSWGDPHILTLDGKRYIFNGLGEYTLLTYKHGGKEFSLQARTERAIKANGQLSDATLFSAFAAFDSYNSSVHVEVNNDNEGFLAFVNKIDVTQDIQKKNSSHLFSDSKHMFVKKYTSETKTTDASIEVSFLSAGVTLNITARNGMLSLSTIVKTALHGRVRGLLGNFDGNPDNDFITPDNLTLDPNMNESEIFDFGKTWEIDASRSAFRYPQKKNHSSFQNSSFVPRFLDTVANETFDAAKATCGGSEDLACIFDQVFTENENISRQTLEITNASQATEVELNRRIPDLQSCGKIDVTTGNESFTCALVFDDNVIKYNIFQNVNQSIEVNLTTKTLIYIHDPETPIQNIRLVVENADGGVSPIASIPVYICSGCSDHGFCLDETVEEQHSFSSFRYRKCRCDEQYTGVNCESDFDGCASNPCSGGRNCTDIPASNQTIAGLAFRCSSCPDGFNDDGIKCQDIDECTGNSSLCEQKCINTEGSYTCVCHEGYRISRTECTDINECEEATHDCPHICENRLGSYSCKCHFGYRHNAASMECEIETGLDPCSGVSLDCSQADGCTLDEENEATCFCNDGYELRENSNICTDIDECTRNVCPQECKNSNGSYTCICYPGFKLHGTKECIECSLPFYGNNCEKICRCSSRGTIQCHSVKGCVCQEGWMGETCDEDVDECVYAINPCNDTYKRCVNTDGSFRCDCMDGFEETREGFCKDINECASPIMNECGKYMDCKNTNGSYTCECNNGYTMIKDSCVDIDECSLGLSGCEYQCENLPGRYNCYCFYGYKLQSDRRSCRQVEDPCRTLGNFNCSHICVIDVTAKCSCPHGYELIDDGQTCYDTNECLNEELNKCSPNNTCKNTLGSYKCDCEYGFKLSNDGRTCEECDIFHYGPNCNKECNCLHGYYDKVKGCNCTEGWSGENCDADLDECNPPDAYSCPGNATCINTLGSFICKCSTGYTLENGTCTNIDECLHPSLNNCDQLCEDTPGTYECKCHKGLFWSDLACTDIDECSPGKGSCEQGCHNTHGSYISMNAKENRTPVITFVKIRKEAMIVCAKMGISSKKIKDRVRVKTKFQ
ncbi:mucin-like protein [Mya arenaria]|uniref:mucin-like protein n=1 Tax=Mya arenaria TaxID=6604 RepID=UPI0022DF8F74|nr:mucin-like protein [Mya arenaria]